MNQNPLTVLISVLLLLIVSYRPLAADSNGVVRLASTDWPPWSGTNLPENGLATKMVRHIFANAGVTVEVDFMPWARAMRATRMGKYDGVFPAYWSQKRSGHYLRTEAYLVSQLSFLGRNKTPVRWHTLTDLTPFRIGIVRGYVNTADFDNNRSLNKDEAMDDEQNLRKLAAGRVDLIIIDRITAQWLLKKNPALEAHGSHWLTPTLGNKRLYILMNRSRNRLRTLFNRSMNELLATGELQQYAQALGLPFLLPKRP